MINNVTINIIIIVIGGYMVEKGEKKLIILIPSYEPDENLTKLIENLNKNKITSIVVDDGSGKDYKKIFDSLDTKVISY